MRTREERDALVAANVGLARHLAYGFCLRTGYPMDELFQEALLGFTRAAEKYDPELGKFSTYAGRWAKAFMGRLVKEEGKRARRYPLWLDEPDPEDTGAMAKAMGKVRKEWISAERARPDELLSEAQESVIAARLFAFLEKPRDREILRACFDGDENMKEVGDRLGLSRERVRQIRERCLKILRQHPAVQELL